MRTNRQSVAKRLATLVLIGAFAALAVAPAFTFAASSSAIVASSRLRNVSCPTNSCSTNWSGYAVTSGAGTVTFVKGSWTVPTATCDSNTAYSSFWVGIDGYNSGTVEQTGTDSDCSSGSPRYYAWYEFYPRPSFIISGLTVSAGDQITAQVQYNGLKFVTTITDTTTGQSSSTSARVNSAQRSSAEWVAEAPSSSGGVLPLANFGTVSFGSTNQATISGVTKNIGAFSTVWQITMVTSGGVVKALPSSLATDQSTFSVTWKSAGP
ncbi:MAG: hypothetical protein HY247_00335 [archaeon]|nr:MAG: hypothetical protein HY247_00335 [archaeon]